MRTPRNHPKASASVRAGRIRRAFAAAAVVAPLLSGCAGATAQPMEGDLFDRFEFATGGGRQTVLTGSFLGGSTDDIAVVYGYGDDAHGLRVFALADGAWEQRLESTLSAEILFVDVANGGERDRLIFYETGGLTYFDLESRTQQPLLEVELEYNVRHDHEGSPTQPPGSPPQVDITRDLDHDGRDDLVLPSVEGFWVSIQGVDGEFTEAVKLGPPEPFRDEPVGNMDVDLGPGEPSRTYGDVGITASTVPLYLRRVHEMDYDQDGRSDLVFWNEDHFDVHLQEESGLFAEEPETFDPGVPFESDGVYSYAFEFRDAGVGSLIFGVGKKRGRTVLHSLHDLDGDQVSDLVTLTLSGRGFTNQRSAYQVHFGESTPDGTRFASQAGSTIHPRGKGGAMQPWGYSYQEFRDLDGDGQVDAMFREVNIGVPGMFRALVGNSVPLVLEFHHFADGTYPANPTVLRKIKRFAPFAGIGNIFFPPVLTGDVDGDGRADLLVGQNPKELQVFLGVPGPDLFAKRPLKVAVGLHPDERNTWLVDLNRDGKQDILVHNGPTGHDPDRPHRLTTLIAQ